MNLEGVIILWCDFMQNEWFWRRVNDIKNVQIRDAPIVKYFFLSFIYPLISYTETLLNYLWIRSLFIILSLNDHIQLDKFMTQKQPLIYIYFSNVQWDLLC